MAAFSPIMERRRSASPRGRPGARHLQRLSIALRGRPARRRAGPQRLAALRVPRRPPARRGPTRRLHARAFRRAALLTHADRPRRGTLTCTPSSSSSKQRVAWSSATATRRRSVTDGCQSQRLGRPTSPACCNAAGNVVGPDAASRARLRSVLGCERRQDAASDIARRSSRGRARS